MHFKQTYLAGLSQRMEKVFPENERINIVIHGHSQTCGYTTGHVIDPFSAYPHQLWELLQHRFPFSTVNVIVTGIGGENSDRGSVRLEEDVLCHKPDLVTIDYALNDRYIDFSKSEAAWDNMTSRLKERGIPVILLTPTLDIPCAYDKDELEKLKRFDEMIHRIAAYHQVGVAEIFQTWMNYLKNFGRVEDLLCGVNHASVLGHRLTAMELNSWFPYPGYQ